MIRSKSLGSIQNLEKQNRVYEKYIFCTVNRRLTSIPCGIPFLHEFLGCSTQGVADSSVRAADMKRFMESATRRWRCRVNDKRIPNEQGQNVPCETNTIQSQWMKRSVWTPTRSDSIATPNQRRQATCSNCNHGTLESFRIQIVS